MDTYDNAVGNPEDARGGPIIRQGSTRGIYLPVRPHTAFEEGPTSAPASYNAYGPRDHRHAYPAAQGNFSRPSTSHRSTSREPLHRMHTNTSSQSRSPHSRPSAASRLRVLNIGSQISNGRRTPDQAYTERAARPSQRSGRTSDESTPPVIISSATFPLPRKDEQRLPHALTVTRERGLSASSSRSYAAHPPISLRTSKSIPDFNSNDSLRTRQRNFSNISGQQERKNHDGIGGAGLQYEAYPRANGMEDEVVRASLRSALTATSSFVGTSGTERSSVLSRSSSATSIFGRDEGMSVDDAIGMYETGFADSGVEDNYPSRPGTSQSFRSVRSKLAPAEDNYPSRPGTSQSHRSIRSKLGQGDNDALALPVIPDKIIRDSAAIFQEHMNNPADDKQTTQVEQPGHLNSTHNSQDGKASTCPMTQSSALPADPTRDRYGFRKKSQHISQAQYDAWDGPYEQYLARRRKKWVALMKEARLPTENPESFPSKSTKVKRFIRKGLPPDWRGAAWFWYAGGPAIIAKNAGVYDDLLRKARNGRVDPNDHEIIERDLNRTFPDNIKFKPDSVNGTAVADPGRNGQQTPAEVETPILQSLRRVLQSFSILNPKIGYCQSLNFLAGLLLLFMDEEKAFWMLNIITRVYLPGTHEVNLEGANVDLGVLMTSIKESMPAIWAKIGGELDGSAGDGRVSMRLPPITLCCTAWFMSCFIGTLPIETTLRVWDSFFYEGSKTLFRIALAIFKVGEAEIRSVSDPMEIFQVVQTIPRRLIDANALMEACFRRRNGFGHLSQATIEARRRERREGYADERAIAAGEAPLARKHTLFTRRRGKTRGTEN